MAERVFPGEIKRWVDGDTADINVDLGFKVWSIQRFRLAGINCPEKGQAGYVEAIEACQKLAPITTKVEVVCTGYDRYGRWIAYVRPYDVPQSVNAYLLENNLAAVYK